MGKKRSNYAGLARFLPVLSSSTAEFTSSTQPSTSPNEPSETLTPTQREPSDVPQQHPSTSIPLISQADAQTEDLQPPTKKRKTTPTPPNDPTPVSRNEMATATDQDLARYDASFLDIPHYTDASQVPEHLQKYFAQRHRFFSLYDSGCLLDEEGWYSVTPEAVADQIAERCRCGTVLDAFCGVGGTQSLSRAPVNAVLIALDTSPTRLALARHNATVYGVADRIEFILADYISFACSIRADLKNRAIDVVFLSPPWGGPAYLDGPNPILGAESDPADVHPEYGLASLKPVSGQELMRLSRRITRNIALYIPRNSRVEEIAELGETLSDTGDAGEIVGGKLKGNVKAGRGKAKGEMIEIEEEWMGNKLKALTCYFGGLAAGQEHLFDQV